MKIYFRVDGSREIGSGHITRCLTLADELSRKGADINFICRKLNGSLGRLVEKKGYKCHNLPYAETADNPGIKLVSYAGWLGVDRNTDAKETQKILEKEKGNIDWLIVDHYALDARWEKQVRPFVKKIMAIDDLAGRPHDCDLLLDQNPREKKESRYDNLVPDDCEKLLGPKYALLRPEFKEMRKKTKKHDGKIRRILVFFGASDLTNETLKTLRAIDSLEKKNITTSVIIGVNNPYKKDIETLADAMQGVSCHYNVNNIAEFMSGADIYIGASGATLLECFSLGLPVLAVSAPTNITEIAEYMAKEKILYYIGKSRDLSHRDIKKVLECFLNQADELKRYSRTSFDLVDALGAERTADAILGK